MRRWSMDGEHKFSGCSAISVECWKDNGIVVIDGNSVNENVPAPVMAVLNRLLECNESIELVYEFDYSGYSYPGKTSGLPERCYPPEYEDERKITRVLGYARKCAIEISKRECDILMGWNYAQEKVEAAEINTDGADDFDSPDPESDYDDGYVSNAQRNREP
jgi:hypothetical protein